MSAKLVKLSILEDACSYKVLKSSFSFNLASSAFAILFLSFATRASASCALFLYFLLCNISAINDSLELSWVLSVAGFPLTVSSTAVFLS